MIRRPVEPVVRDSTDGAGEDREGFNWKRKALRWVIVAGVSALFWSLLHYVNGIAPGNLALRVDHARFLPSGAVNPPHDSVPGWTDATLPDNWLKQHPGLEQGWYRFDLDLDVSAEELWAVYLPCLSMNAAVYVNGELLGSGGRFAQPVARNWNRPLYFTLPSGLLDPGTLRIDVRVAAEPAGSGMLGTVYVGPDMYLHGYFALRQFVRITLAEILSIVMLLTTLLMAALWKLRRHEPVFGWFALATLVWNLHGLNLFIVNIPVPAIYWDWFWYVTLGWFVILIVPYIHSFLGYRRPRVEYTVYAVGAVVSLALLWLAASGSPWFYPLMTRGVTGAMLALGLYPTWLMIEANVHRPGPGRIWMLAAGMLVLTFGARDWFLDIGLIARDAGYYLLYSAPVVLGTFAWILLTRFVSALEVAEALNRELEQRVDRKREQLERNFERVRRLERRELITLERERIMLEMHDGVGGYLVSTLAMLEEGEASRKELASVVRDALNDLRLMLDSLEPVDGDLLAMLGMFRARVQPLLERTGVKLVWNVRDLPPLPGLGPSSALHILRILQEAVTNVLKHAAAHSIEVTTGSTVDSDTACVFVDVRDDGRGFLENRPPAGRGLGNMRSRARRINGWIHIRSGARGTTVRLCLPMHIDVEWDLAE